QIGDRAHEQAAGAAALRKNGSRIRIAFCDQRLGHGDEIRECVALIEHATFGVPAFTFFVSPTYMGNRINEAAIKQSERGARETCTKAETVGAVANDQRRITFGPPHTLAVDDCDWNAFTVGCRCTELIEHIATVIEPANCGVLLAQG